jgi:nucleotide-binding universal stress UspA family protein
MLMKILIPVDGGPLTAELVPAFRHWVGGTGAQVYLLAVRPQPTRIERRGDRIVHLDEQQAEEQATWRCYLTGLRGQLAYAGVVVRQAVQFGDPLAQTLAAAERYGVEAIAVAEPRQSWLQRACRPSLAQQLLACATVPVLVMPGPLSHHPSARLQYRGAAI